MSERDKSQDKRILIGAAFLMATSAIGPGFLTQTTTFTAQLGPTFGFVILVSVLFSLIAQVNIWRVICISKARGQDIANKVFPGLGYVVAILVAMGGLAFNIGNVGGAGLGLQVLFGLDLNVAIAISGIIGIIIFSVKQVGNAMDKFATFCGALMIILILYVSISSKPPVGQAIKETFVPSSFPYLQILTLIGGTVGGYISFSGGHRLIDAGIVGEENFDRVNQSAFMGMGVATIVRILLFLAVLGVVSTGVTLDASNPAADAFKIAAGTLGYKIFGMVMAAAALTSVVGAAFTSVSFLRTLIKPIGDHVNITTIAFIVASTAIQIFVGSPAKVLVIVGSLNGLILPLTLGTILVASKRKDIVGEYKHAQWLFILGWIVVAVTAVLGLRSLTGIAALWK
ncbi:MAG TPA: divalent metal cation transporter [Sedimentibacter sp.]|nr:divalent metal cation transporter [Sedimentibacter sp.]